MAGTADRRDLAGQWALVTGASAGLGAEFCRQLADRGASLVLVARRGERLEQVAQAARGAGVETLCLAIDLAAPEGAAQVLAACSARGIDIDVLVNNAGFGLTGLYTDHGWQTEAAYLQLMVIACAQLSHGVLPGMKARGRGRILNVASVAGLVPPSAGQTLYGPAKAFLISFSQALAAEGAPYGIKVSALCPGVTKTEFFTANGTDARIGKVSEFWKCDAVDVARAGLVALERGKTVCVPGYQYKAMVLLARWLPMGWVEALSRAQNRHYRAR